MKTELSGSIPVEPVELMGVQGEEQGVAAVTSGEGRDEVDKGAEGEGAEGESGEEVRSKAPREKKEVNVEFLPLDLSSFQSTTDFVRAFKEKQLPLHILINNAGVAWIPFRK